MKITYELTVAEMQVKLVELLQEYHEVDDEVFVTVIEEKYSNSRSIRPFWIRNTYIWVLYCVLYGGRFCRERRL
jgi:hypothetical protein